MSETDSSGAGELRETYSDLVPPLAPPDVFDPVIEAYKKDVDRTLIRECLRRTPHERAVRMQDAILCVERWRGIAWRQEPVKRQPPEATNGSKV